MKDLKELQLKELRELHPNISARSREEFLNKLANEQEVVDLEEVKPKENNEEDIVDFLYSKSKSRDKILIEFPTSMDADNAFAIVQFELFPKLEADGITVSASSHRRDMHLNGTCYARLTCTKNFNLVKGLTKFNVIKELK